MANTNIDTALEIYSNKVIEGLSNALPALRAFSLDLSEEASQPGARIRVPLVTADKAGAWNRDNNNYSRDPASLKDKYVQINKRPIAGSAVTQDQLHHFRPNWWERKGELNALEVADSVLGDVFSLVTPGRYNTHESIPVALGAFDHKAISTLRGGVVKCKLRPERAVLVLNPDFFSELLGSLDATIYGGREAILSGVIPGILGFRAIIEAPQLSAPGFVAHPDAIAVASRVVQVADTTPYGAFGPITEPDTGLTLNRVMFTAGATGDTSLSIECLFGVDVGNKDALVLLSA